MLLNETRIGFLKVLDRMGVILDIREMGNEPEPWGNVTARHSGNMVARSVPAKEIPGLIDEIPILALAATQAYGATTFHGVGELRIKETDRIAAIVELLSAMGAKVEAGKDDLRVEGPVKLQPVERLDSFGDHRMAMTARLAGLAADCDPEIIGEELRGHLLSRVRGDPEGAAEMKCYGVMGGPGVVKSLSPVMHNAAFAAEGIDARYVAFPVEEGRIHGRHGGRQGARHLRTERDGAPQTERGAVDG